MLRVFKVFLFLFWSANVYCQYDFVVDALSLGRSKLKMTKLQGTFEREASSSSDAIRKYKFDDHKTDLIYVENNRTNECDSFVLFGKRFGIKGKFENNLACHLDVTSLELFVFSFKSRKYILVQSIKNASGTATSFIIFHLFDVTQKSNIVYFPIWSVYGSKSCFADFNNDGDLDFLTIREIRTTVDSGTYKVTLSSTDYKSRKFRSKNDNRQITFRRTYNKNDDMVITILTKKW